MFKFLFGRLRQDHFERMLFGDGKFKFLFGRLRQKSGWGGGEEGQKFKFLFGRLRRISLYFSSLRQIRLNSSLVDCDQIQKRNLANGCFKFKFLFGRLRPL